MRRLLNYKTDINFLINPFYLFVIAFTLSLFTYIWGWSKLYPEISASLLIFFFLLFLFFITAGYFSKKNKPTIIHYSYFPERINDIIFLIILSLGILNVLLTGYLPVFNKTHDYREFGVPVVDVLFNTLSIFFSLVIFQTYLKKKKFKDLVFFIVILIFQVLIYRRSTIVWIIVSSLMLYILSSERIKSWIILAVVLLIPFVSYCFGLFGTLRSNFTRDYITDELGASDCFKRLNISPNHYMTYLYVSSPLANLQANIERTDDLFKNRELRDYLFYSIIPPSFTMRLEKRLNLAKPECKLIHPDLIAGSCLMYSYFTMGWSGMVLSGLFIFIYILLCLVILRYYSTFYLTGVALLSTASSLMIFDNFFIRLDVILMLFIYPVLFHFIYQNRTLQKTFATE